MQQNILLALSFLLYTSLQGQHTDCANARLLCDQSPVIIDKLPHIDEKPESILLKQVNVELTETNSIWFKWKMANSGNLSFSLTPKDKTDDLDFVLYRLNSNGTCATLETMRFMTAGPKLGEAGAFTDNCQGITGLRDETSLLLDDTGCLEEQYYFLNTIETLSDEWYLLLVNNFHSSGGFRLDFGGTTDFRPINDQCIPLITGQVDKMAKDIILFSDVQPNPASNRACITVTSPSSHDGRMSITDVNGREINATHFETISGRTDIDIPLEKIPAGTFFVRLQIGSQLHVASFVKI